MSDSCQELHQLLNSRQTFRFPFDARVIPLNGIYILFEEGEFAHGTNRIVRVGSHTGKDQLPSRLHQHFINENKDRSIFRKNIGRAILNKAVDPFLDQWNIDLTTREAKARYAKIIDETKQRHVEQQVTEYMRKAMSFTVLSVPERTTRLDWETKLIATLSHCHACQPSMSWLGRFSPVEKISRGKLWQVKDIDKESLTSSELEQISKNT